MWDSRFNRQRTSTACTVEAGSPSRAPISTGPSRLRHRNATIFFTSRCGVRPGCRCGRLDRSRMSSTPGTRPAASTSAKRRAQRWAVRYVTSNRRADIETDQPPSTTNRPSFSRALGVRAALAWDMKASWSGSGS
jgi:hypothetical protein